MHGGFFHYHGRLPFSALKSLTIFWGQNFPRQQAGFSILSWKSLEPYVLAVGTEKRSWTPGFGILAQYLDYVLIHTQARRFRRSGPGLLKPSYVEIVFFLHVCFNTNGTTGLF